MLEWIKHTGVIGGYPPKVKIYWEGKQGNETRFWISPLSNKEWHLISAGREQVISIRDKDCEKLKDLAKENMNATPQEKFT